MVQRLADHFRNFQNRLEVKLPAFAARLINAPFSPMTIIIIAVPAQKKTT
jgi:hypothetical protein